MFLHEIEVDGNEDGQHGKRPDAEGESREEDSPRNFRKLFHARPSCFTKLLKLTFRNERKACAIVSK